MAGSLEDYRAKRDFARTPEPRPGRRPRARERHAFVVHRHDARHLHYDLRLEMEGVLKSWAVPRGFSYDPSVKRLAVRTEDHPLEYETFEGVIPKGEYGAGTMTIWDSGTYDLLEPDDPRDIGRGKVNVRLRGRRLLGEWHLFRPDAGRDRDWLVVKARDRYSRPDGDGALGGDLRAAREAPFPRTVRLMRPAGTCAPFSDPQWVFEAWLDGLRAAALVQGGAAELRTGRRRGLLERLPAIAQALRRLRAEQAVLDGVLVSLDDKGRPSRDALEMALAGGPDAPVAYYAFDLLRHEEWDTRAVPLLDRKARLASILPDSRVLLFVDHVLARGEDLAATVAAGGLPGIIAKDARSRYVGGRSSAWRRIPVDPAEGASERSFDGAMKAQAPAAPRSRRVRFSNLRKVFFPKTGKTKGDLLDYYDHVADHLLPYLAERPVHMLRHPDGVEGPSFYQREVPAHVPDWIETAHLPSEGKGRPIRHAVCNDRDTLLYLVNLGSIDLHPWMSRRATPDAPDWVVIDLDPKEAPFSMVVKVARAVGKLLHALGLHFSLKTSGKTGIHVYVPLEPGYTFEQGCMFAETVARIVAKEHRDLATVERDTGRRGGRVYVDAFQNRRGQTVVPPYVVRPVADALVSTPITWEELDDDLHPSRFGMHEALDRLSTSGDLFRPTLDDPQDLLPAIEALAGYVSG